METTGKRFNDSNYGKRFDDHTFKQVLRSWPVIVSIITACWVLYNKFDSRFKLIDSRLETLDIHQAILDDKIENVKENVKLLLKR